MSPRQYLTLAVVVGLFIESLLWGKAFAGPLFIEAGLGRCMVQVKLESGDYDKGGRETCGTVRLGGKWTDGRYYIKTEWEHVSDVQENDKGHNSVNVMVGVQF